MTEEYNNLRIELGILDSENKILKDRLKDRGLPYMTEEDKLKSDLFLEYFDRISYGQLSEFIEDKILKR